MKESILEVKNLHFAYDEHHTVLDGISLSVFAGERIAILGSNGAGKSTFLKILSGQLEPTNGEVAITPGERLSFLQQDHFKYDEYPVLDTVIMGNARLYEIMKEKEAIYAKEDFTDEDGIKASELEGEFATMNGWEAESDAASLLNGLGIETDLHYKMMKDMTGPQKVKVLLAQALFGNPDILLLDEPTNHLDMESITALNNGLIKFPGVLLFTSRDHQIVQTTANRIMEILPDGSMIDKMTTYDEYLKNNIGASKRQAILDLNTEEQDD